MDIKTFVNITSRAWALSILAQFHKGVAGRQAPLLIATGASRTAFRQSMEHLIEIGLVERNPGYGHPLRPEFRLTKQGEVAAKFAFEAQQIADFKEHDILRRNWTIPVLISVREPQPFGEIRRNLPRITDRALSQSLHLLEDRQWIKRDIDGMSRPPKALYCAANAGSRISNAAHIYMN